MMINYSFTDKVAVVTGAGKGIGYEIARQLCKAGASVVLNDVEAPLSHEAAQAIDREFGRCISIPGDCSKLSIIDKIIETAIDKFGRLDFAICNAGITIFCDIMEYTSEDFNRLLSVNLYGTFFMAQRAARAFINQDEGGRILFMSSVTGHSAHPNLSAYGMTKSGIEMLAKNLAIELSQYNINVNAIAPGATLTERNLIDDPNYEEHWEKLIPTGRVGTPEDIANTALFLLSEESSQINGQSIIVDGGWTITSPTPD